MNSIERVRAAIHFKNPEQVPVFNVVRGDVLPLPVIFSKNWRPGWGENEIGLFPHVVRGYKWDRPPWAKENPAHEGNKWRKIPHEEIDEWGCIWNMSGREDNMGHPGRTSLLDWNNHEDYLSRYNTDPDEKSRYSAALQLREKFGADKYRMVLFSSFGPSQIAAAMRGFDTYLIDHFRHPKELKRVLEHVTEFHVKMMKASFKFGLDPHGFWVVDDLGEQKGPFFSPRTFKTFYEPVYKTICDEAHDLGCDVHLHCCGKVDKLMPLFIEWGLDAIEFDSPRMSGYAELKPYRGKIMFWACANIQSIYTKGTPEEVEGEVWHMMRNLGTPEGGFGAYFYPTPRDIQAPRKNVKAFERGLTKYGEYSKIPAHWWTHPTIEDWKDNEVPPLPPIES